MGISTDTLTAIGAWAAFFSLVWMALVGEAVGPLVWRWWRARRARQEEGQAEQPVELEVRGLAEMGRQLETAVGNLAAAVREAAEQGRDAARQAREEGERAHRANIEVLEDLRELLLIDAEVNLEAWTFEMARQRQRQAPSSS
ncbi:hypothetical protein B0J12DRAFT_757689 [Macrophomina phaseolina]|uniref:Uncharacterized protein n=1 Tax=Macrophomina phaseolina TaxID=35725 RepID=A0ABQ8G5K0_9PEZI|nr:hypothetical protein B0J12DRAFT_757689 [Macrophomina phaseolina]